MDSATGGYGRVRKNNRLNVRISDDDLETINSISFEDDESVAQVIRKAIKVYDAIRKNKKHY